MPTPYKERDAWEQELRKELPELLAAHQLELVLVAGAADQQRQEWLEWQVRRVQKRMAELEARLARSSAGQVP